MIREIINWNNFGHIRVTMKIWFLKILVTRCLNRNIHAGYFQVWNLGLENRPSMQSFLRGSNFN